MYKRQVHALSYPLGGKYHIPHGVSNAMLLLPVMRFNKSACLKEFAELFDAVEGNGGRNQQMTDEEKADRLLVRMEEIIRRLEIPSSLCLLYTSGRISWKQAFSHNILHHSP